MAESIAYNMDCVPINENYLAYSDGMIFSRISNRFLKPMHRKNYDYVMVERKSVPVHRIIASCFVPNPDNKPCINHVDGNKRNNSSKNLEWCTYSENLRHAYTTGLNNSERPVIRVNENGEQKRYRSARAAEVDGFSNQLIAMCCKGKRKHHGGYKWRYADEL